MKAWLNIGSEGLPIQVSTCDAIRNTCIFHGFTVNRVEMYVDNEGGFLVEVEVTKDLNDKLYKMSEALGQDCIAVCSGALVGPKARDWGSFDIGYFVNKT